MNFNSLQRQQGTILLSTLLVLSIMLVLTTSVMLQQRLDIYRTSELIEHAQAYEYALGVERFAEAKLKQPNFELHHPETIILPLKDNAEAQGVLSNAQTRINLNAVTDEKRTKEFIALLKILFPSMEEDTRYALSLTLKQWLSPSDKSLGESCKSIYANVAQPYRCAGQPMQFISELELLQGFTSSVVHTLLPFVIALPAGVETQVKDAPKEIQLALQASHGDNNLSLNQANQGDGSGQRSDTSGTQKFAANAPSNSISSSSDYYLLETRVSYRHMDIHLYSLLKRQVLQTPAVVRVLWRSQRTL
jgi:type II secretory pathway component PulK